MSKSGIYAKELAEQALNLIRSAEDKTVQPKQDAELLERLSNLLRESKFRDHAPLSREVTILLSDIRGFSDVSASYPANDVVRMLNRYFATMSDIISEFGGTIDKLMGDSILAVFGLPEPQDDDIRRAVACAVKMQLAMQEFNKENQSHGMPDLYHGIGLNTGQVVASELGSKHYNEYTIIGDAVNLASRIEAHCLRGQVLVSDRTKALIEGFAETGPANRVEVKGAKDPVELFEVYSTSYPDYMSVPRRDGRKSPRVPITMPVKFQILSGKLVLPEHQEGELVDISYHGMLMITDFYLPPLSEIKMKVALEFFGDRTAEIYARIIKSDKRESRYQCGMEFTSIDQEAQNAIKRLVDQLVMAT
jgi:adenylate cyclase